jgi:hypothetical protein
MTSLPIIIRRHFTPMLAMTRDILTRCPEAVLMQPQLDIREHLYHALVGMEIWLSPDPMAYPFDTIVDDDAAQLERQGPASDRITRPYLLDMVDRLEAQVAALPDDAGAFLTDQEIRGRTFTLLDRCLGQLRHVQHHLGVVNEKLRRQHIEAADWVGYGEG